MGELGVGVFNPFYGTASQDYNTEIVELHRGKAVFSLRACERSPCVLTYQGWMGGQRGQRGDSKGKKGGQPRSAVFLAVTWMWMDLKGGIGGKFLPD